MGTEKNRVNQAFPTAAGGDSLDWKDLKAEDIVTRVLKRVQPGSVMLFHNGAKNTPAALPQIIEKLQAEGYKIVPATELLLPEPTTIDHKGTQQAAPQSGQTEMPPVTSPTALPPEQAPEKESAEENGDE